MEFLNLIQNAGFPTACCAALGYYLNSKDKLDREERQKDKEADRAREDRILETNSKLLATNEQLADAFQVTATELRADLNRTENKIDKILEERSSKLENLGKI